MKLFHVSTYLHELHCLVILFSCELGVLFHVSVYLWKPERCVIYGVDTYNLQVKSAIIVTVPGT